MRYLDLTLSCQLSLITIQPSQVLACRLDHENVVKVFRVYGVEQRHAIIIMEYVGSKNLHHLLVERREKYLGRDWLLDVAIQVSLLSSLPLVDS